MTAPEVSRVALVTLGLLEGQRERLADWDATHVVVDLQATKTVDQYLLDVVDAAGERDAAIVLVGPLAFGWVCSGQLRDLPGWATTMTPRAILVVAPDQEDRETAGMASETYVRLGARAGVWLHLDAGLDAIQGARLELERGLTDGE